MKNAVVVRVTCPRTFRHLCRLPSRGDGRRIKYNINMYFKINKNKKSKQNQSPRTFVQDDLISTFVLYSTNSCSAFIRTYFSRIVLRYL